MAALNGQSSGRKPIRQDPCRISDPSFWDHAETDVLETGRRRRTPATDAYFCPCSRPHHAPAGRFSGSGGAKNVAVTKSPMRRSSRPRSRGSRRARWRRLPPLLVPPYGRPRALVLRRRGRRADHLAFTPARLMTSGTMVAVMARRSRARRQLTMAVKPPAFLRLRALTFWLDWGWRPAGPGPGAR